MIIRENKIIDQFPTPKLLANHSALFSIVIDVIIVIVYYIP